MKEMLEALLKHLTEQEGGGVLLFHRTTDRYWSWLVSYEFGQEAPDSPMVGGAAYGAAETAEEAVRQVVQQCGLSVGEEPSS